jgi:hypothetical protein
MNFLTSFFKKDKKKVHFLHIGKTGGTAVKSIMNDYPVTREYSIEHHPHSIKLEDIPKGEKIIFFLRNPISRYVSGFYSRQRKGRPRHFSEWNQEEAVAFSYFNTPNQLGLALFDKNSPDHDNAVSAMKGIRHVNSSYYDWFKDADYFQLRAEDILFVGHLECLDGDFEKLKEILGLPPQAALPTDDVSAHRAPDSMGRHLEENALIALKEWYRVDYDFIQLCEKLKLSSST